MAEGIDTAKRKFLKLAALTAAGTAAAAAGAGARELLPDPGGEFKRKVKEFRAEDFDNPEKLAKFILTIVGEYVRISNTNESAQDLLAKTHLHQSEEGYVNAVKENFYRNYELPEGGSLGHARRDRVDINLEHVKKTAEKWSPIVPGIALIEPLLHEWNHNGIPRIVGKYLNNSKTLLYFKDKQGVGEKFKKYIGGKVYTSNLSGYDKFNEAWTELIAQRVLLEMLKGDEKLLISAIPILTNPIYYNRTVHLAPLVDRAGISTNELQEWHELSYFELFAERIGSLFEASVLEELVDQEKGGRSEAEQLSDIRFLAGTRVFNIVESASWKEGNDPYDQMLSHIREK